jgi:hypothetical protein
MTAVNRVTLKSRWLQTAIAASLALIVCAGNAVLHLSHNHAASTCGGLCAAHYYPHTRINSAPSTVQRLEAGHCASCLIINHRASSAALVIVPLELFFRFAPFVVDNHRVPCAAIIHTAFLRAPPSLVSL